jgi:hypothetical protein
MKISRRHSRAEKILRISNNYEIKTFPFVALMILACHTDLMAQCCGGEAAKTWEYQYEVAHPGSRSESISGRLLYMGKELPKEFGHVVTPAGEFVFREAKGWGGGPPFNWLPALIDKNGKVTPATREAEAKELLSGKSEAFRSTTIKHQPTSASAEAAISGKFEERPKDAGVDWFFSVNKNLWVNPAKMDAAIKEIIAKPSSP